MCYFSTPCIISESIMISHNEKQITAPTFKPFLIDPQQHVKMWFSRDGIPEKHQARFIKFRLLNPDATLRLIYSDKYLTPAARKNIHYFAKQVNIILVDYETIQPVNEEEELIKKSIDQELEYFFTTTDSSKKGNLSVVADRLKLFEKVLALGIQSDCDVEFNTPLPKKPIVTKLGLIAKTRKGIDGFKGGIRVSNDLFGGNPKHPVFVTAKKLICDYIQNYHKALPDYFRDNGIEFDPSNYDNHPHYFHARNRHLSAFSLCNGPQLFAVAFHLHGILTGYENIAEPELFILEGNLTLKPYHIKTDMIPKKNVREIFSLLLPPEMGKSLVACWDHSWQEGNSNWKILNLSESRLINKFKLHLALQSSVPVSPSHLKNYFSYFIYANLPERRHREFHELTQDVQTYIKENETPDEAIRASLSETLGQDFTKIAKRFSSDGVLILPGFFKGKQLRKLQDAFATEIAKKTPHPFLKQTAFNAAVDTDEVDAKTVDTVLEAATDPRLQALIKHHFGKNQTVAGMRGYRQLMTPPVLYRAWDFHQDQKARGPFGEIKIMLLINGVEIEGQAMRVMKGSHHNHWHYKSQQQTKYTMDEGLSYAEDNLATICYGPPGTVILFDTNILHSGHRNEHSVRDIFSINYTPDSKEAPIMHEKFAERKDTTTRQEYKTDPGFWQNLSVTNGTLSKKDTLRELEHYRSIPTIEQLKERFNHEDCLSFEDFLITAIATDVNGDLDLPIRKGKEDVARDNQLIAFRDVPPTHKQYQRIKEKIKSEKMIINYAVNIDAIRQYAKLSGDYKESKVKEISHCALFALDLCDAFTRIDSRQRLRTTMAYLYFTLDHMYLMTKDEKFNQAANHVLKNYISLVYLDDLAYRLEEQNQRTVGVRLC